VATFIASPQSFNYDLIPLCVAALVLARSTSKLDAILAALIWSAPFSVMLVNAARLPIVPIVLTVAAFRLDLMARSESHDDFIAA
jgi:hypothetical protein